METEDIIKLPASSSSETEAKNDGVRSSDGERVGGDSLPGISGIQEGGECAKEDGECAREDGECAREDEECTKEDGECAREDGECAREDGEYAREDEEYAREDGEIGRTTETVNVENEDTECQLASEFDEDMDISPPPSQVCAELTEVVSVTEKITCLSSEMHAENGFTTSEQGNSLGNHSEGILFASSQEILATALTGVKRPRTTGDRQQSSLRVSYDSLKRESRQKLEELLQQWSQWDARHCSSPIDSNEVLESGEETYFPALHVGIDKTSAVSFWMDNQTKNPSSEEFIPLDGNVVPFYDRGFSLALTSTDGSSNLERGFEVLDTSRCFNCGSYSHSLKDCPKPRDNVAVNSARKQLKSRRNQNPGSRNPTRYYQSSPKGKFDGLKPGVLDAETRRLLGLGELDPPPWLNRMREIGYPPGYLDPEDEDQPSGIIIFADEESKEETEEGEILGAGSPEPGNPDPPTKKTVEFPGINAPIPENADKRRWEAGSSSFNLSRNHSYRRYDHSSESISRGHYYEQSRSRDYQDDGPPGCDPRSSQSLSGYSHRYGSHDSGNSSGRRSPSSGRSLTDRSRRSTQDDYSNRGVYGSLP